MFCSMMAGACASIATNPLDIVKLRMQVHRASSNEADQYKHIVDGLIKMVKNEGPKSLFNGTFARVIHQIPTVAISMATLEMVRPRMQKLLDSHFA